MTQFIPLPGKAWHAPIGGAVNTPVRATHEDAAGTGRPNDFAAHLRDQAAPVKQQNETNAGFGREATTSPGKEVSGPLSPRRLARGVLGSECAAAEALKTPLPAYAKKAAPFITSMYGSLVSLGGRSGLSARIFLEHWYGNGYLSTVTKDDASKSGVPPGDRESPGVMDTVTLAAVRIPSVPLMHVRSGKTVENMRLLGLLVDSVECNGFGAPRHETSPDGVHSAGPLHAFEQTRFPACLIWQARSDSGLVTAWIRDFRIRERDRAAVARKVITLAEQIGSSIQRVIINGRLAWMAGNPSASTSTFKES